MADFEKYYEEELRFLQEGGQEFAEAFPERARHLNITTIEDRDPYVERLFEGFHRVVTSDARAPVDASQLGKLGVLAGVREFPMRVKCATLAWHTLRAALAGGATATTE